MLFKLHFLFHLNFKLKFLLSFQLHGAPIKGHCHHNDYIYKFHHQKDRLNITFHHLNLSCYDNHRYNLSVLLYQVCMNYSFFSILHLSMNKVLVLLPIIIIIRELQLVYISLISFILSSHLFFSCSHCIIFIFLFIRLIIIYLIRFNPVFY